MCDVIPDEARVGLDPWTRLLMVAEALNGVESPEFSGSDDAEVLLEVHRELKAEVRGAQVAILRELLGVGDPDFPPTSARDLAVSFMDKLRELEARDA